MSPENLTLGLAFIAGLISFISPCVLPLVPAYIGYMGGRVTNTVVAQVSVSGEAALRPPLSARFNTVVNGVFFVLGFTFVFVTIGLLSTALIQQVGGQNVSYLTGMIGRIGGLVIIVFGLHFMGVMPTLLSRVQANQKLLENPLLGPAAVVIGAAVILWGFTGSLLPPLNVTVQTTVGAISVLQWPTLIALILLAIYLLWLLLDGAFTRPVVFWGKLITGIQTAFYADTRRQMVASGRQGYGASALMGVVFAAGWTPCIGPVYGAVLTLAFNTGDVARAAPLLAVYSFGLGVPFVLTALLLDSAQGMLRRLQRHMHRIELVSGAFLVLIGILVATNTLQNLSQQALTLLPGLTETSVSLEESVIDSIMGPSEESAPTAVPDGSAGAGLPSVSAAAEGMTAPVEGLDVGNLAPDFSTVTVSGETIRLSDLRGQVVILNFWATWCGPCRVEMPGFEQAFQSYGDDGITILAVNNRETSAQVEAFRQEFELSFPLLMDESGAIQDQYGIVAYPSTLIIGRDGVIVERHFAALSPRQIEVIAQDALAV